MSEPKIETNPLVINRCSTVHGCSHRQHCYDIYYRALDISRQSSSPAETEMPSAPGTLATLEEVTSAAPTTDTEENTTSAPNSTTHKVSFCSRGASTAVTKESRTSEIPAPLQTASENTAESSISPTPPTEGGDTSAPGVSSISPTEGEDTSAPGVSSISPTPLTEGEGTSAPAIPSTAAEALTERSLTEGDLVTSALARTEPFTSPASPSTLSEVPLELTTPASTVTVPPTPEPAGVTTQAPAESTTPEAAAPTEPTTAAKPVTTSHTLSVAPTPTAPITTTRLKTTPAPTDPAIPPYLPTYTQLMLLRYLTGLCGPRRPGMPRVTLQGCVRDPTCGNYYSPGSRMFWFRVRGPIYRRVCLRCRISACYRYSYSFHHYQGYLRRGKRSTSDSITIIIDPQ
ncbi:uncharacterized protein LOC128852687 [Cuculus canorus]|uniref:uncharacterized protein LOC128852687 n=1 Tax=Cuculus canorus TaxID=55661 RepID=UPI0023AA931F|nr:uncharacterized protein LOC128852687 [Cuculus canorus]